MKKCILSVLAGVFCCLLALESYGANAQTIKCEKAIDCLNKAMAETQRMQGEIKQMKDELQLKLNELQLKLNEMNKVKAENISLRSEINELKEGFNIWIIKPLDGARLSKNEVGWKVIKGMEKSIKINEDVKAFITYSINLQPHGKPEKGFVGVRLSIDGKPYRESASHYQPYSLGDSNTTLSGNVVIDELSAGEHNIKLEWKSFVSPVDWGSHPGWADKSVAGRTVVILTFPKI